MNEMGICQSCKKRKATVKWNANGSTLEMVHGLLEERCELCAVEGQIEVAMSAVTGLSGLFRKWAELTNGRPAEPAAAADPNQDQVDLAFACGVREGHEASAREIDRLRGWLMAIRGCSFDAQKNRGLMAARALAGDPNPSAMTTCPDQVWARRVLAVLENSIGRGVSIEDTKWFRQLVTEFHWPPPTRATPTE